MARKRAVKLHRSKATRLKANGLKVNGANAHVEKKEEHPTGLWVDADVFARLRSGSGEKLKKETFSATQHYLDLAALVLDGKRDRKKKARSKSSGDPEAE